MSSFNITLLTLISTVVFIPAVRAQINTAPTDLPFAPPPGHSTSAAEPPASVPEPTAEGATRSYPVPAGTYKFGPLSVFGLSAKFGTNGFGLDLTSAIAPRFAIRTGASFLSANIGGLSFQGIQLSADLKLQSAFAGVDFYPFHNSFRITPGLAFANRTAANARLFIPGGTSFSFGDAGDSISDPNDPVHGTADFAFGHSIAPRLTFGWANIIPHRSKTITFPLEIGAQTISRPTAKLNITGSACDIETSSADSGCGPVDQTSVAQEQVQLQHDLKAVPIYPIFSVGVTYWFGRYHNPR